MHVETDVADTAVTLARPRSCSAAQQSSRSRFARYTQRARTVVVGAQEVARQQGNHFVGTEHVLLGILGESEGLGAQVLGQLTDADVEAVARAKLHRGQESAPPARGISASPSTRCATGCGPSSTGSSPSTPRICRPSTESSGGVGPSVAFTPVPSFADARALAELTLADHLPERWLHTQAVAREAIRLAALPEVGREPLITAAVLHDIGYSPVVARTGFHPLDGARFLAARGYDRRVAALVAHHSAASVEARLREIDGIERFDDEATAIRDALWYCDAVCGPTGEPTTPDQRWDDVRRRYGPGHVVSRSLDQAEPRLRAAVDRTRARITAAGLAPSTTT